MEGESYCLFKGIILSLFLSALKGPASNGSACGKILFETDLSKDICRIENSVEEEKPAHCKQYYNFENIIGTALIYNTTHGETLS